MNVRRNQYKSIPFVLTLPLVADPSAVLSFVVLWTAGLHAMSYLLVGKSFGSILVASYGWKWNRQSVNLGLLWYFQMQMFRRFRRYFLILINGLPYVVVVPIGLRLHRFPMVVVSLVCLIYVVVV